MTSKERIEAAFKGEPTDKIPVHHVSCSSSVAKDLLGREVFIGFGIQEWREARALWDGPDAHAEFGRSGRVGKPQGLPDVVCEEDEEQERHVQEVAVDVLQDQRE